MTILDQFLEIARKEIGVHEFKDGSNPRIIQYDSVTSLKATSDKVPWCAAFACWVIEQCDVISPRSAAARSFLDWGMSIESPVLGCIVVYSRGSNINSGHVNFFTDWHYPSEKSPAKDILIAGLGGNQRDSVNISYYLSDHVLDFRIPK